MANGGAEHYGGGCNTATVEMMARMMRCLLLNGRTRAWERARRAFTNKNVRFSIEPPAIAELVRNVGVLLYMCLERPGVNSSSVSLSHSVRLAFTSGRNGVRMSATCRYELFGVRACVRSCLSLCLCRACMPHVCMPHTQCAPIWHWVSDSLAFCDA